MNDRRFLIAGNEESNWWVYDPRVLLTKTAIPKLGTIERQTADIKADVSVAVQEQHRDWCKLQEK
jgi:hypothetical protein